MDNKNGIFILFALITMVFIQVVIRSIGIDNIPIQIADTFLFVVNVFVIVMAYKERNKGLGARYNTIVATLTSISCLFGGVFITIYKCYPKLEDSYGEMSFILFMISFFSLLLFIIIYRAISIAKHK